MLSGTKSLFFSSWGIVLILSVVFWGQLSSVLANAHEAPQCGFSVQILEEQKREIYFTCYFDWYFKKGEERIRVRPQHIARLHVSQMEEEKPEISITLVDGKMLDGLYPTLDFPFENGEIFIGGILADGVHSIPWESIQSLTRLDRVHSREKYFDYSVIQGDPVLIKVKGLTENILATEVSVFQTAMVGSGYAYGSPVGPEIKVREFKRVPLRHQILHVQQGRLIFAIKAFLISEIRMKEKLLVLKNSEKIVFDSLRFEPGMRYFQAQSIVGTVVFSLDDIDEILFLDKAPIQTELALDKENYFQVTTKQDRVVKTEDIYVVAPILRDDIRKRLLLDLLRANFAVEEDQLKDKDFTITITNQIPLTIGNLLFLVDLKSVSDLHVKGNNQIVITMQDGRKWSGNFLFDTGFRRWEFTDRENEEDLYLSEVYHVKKIRQVIHERPSAHVGS
ncbi:MAG: hypothetical protein R3B74_10770 [Nitrospirales bacterium]|nr:hypothetical protein [Nitrospirales bacterium]